MQLAALHKQIRVKDAYGVVVPPEAKGVPLRIVALLFCVLVGIAVALASQMVGVLLVFSLLIGPAAIAQRLCSSVLPGLTLSLAIGVGTTWASLVLAYLTNWPVAFWAPALLFGLYVTSLTWPLPGRGPT